MSYNKYITQYTNHIFDVNYIALSLLQIACILFPLVIIYGQPNILNIDITYNIFIYYSIFYFKNMLLYYQILHIR